MADKEIAVIVVKVKIGKVTHELTHSEVLKLRDALNSMTGYDRPQRYYGGPWWGYNTTSGGLQAVQETYAVLGENLTGTQTITLRD